MLSTRPGPFARLAATARAGDLDRALCEGADPSSSRPLAARAATLTSARHRASLADGIERWLHAVDRPVSRRRVLPARDATASNAPGLRDLVARLRSPESPSARAVALAERLVRDGTASPAYTGDRAALRHSIGEANAAFARPVRVGASYRLPNGGGWVHGRRDG
jgi:hypothetical protein